MKISRCAGKVMVMLKSCAYCGRIHERKYICPQKAAADTQRESRRKLHTEQDALRNTNAWKKKSRHIRERDNYMCQACLNGIGFLEGRRITMNNLQVHHIIPLKEDRNRAFDSDNLITLCEQCHKLAEAGKIPRKKLWEIAEESEKIPPGV